MYTFVVLMARAFDENNLTVVGSLIEAEEITEEPKTIEHPWPIDNGGVDIGYDNKFYVCIDSDTDPILHGVYFASSPTFDGVYTYTNGHHVSFFRNQNIWSLGSIELWPPKVFYACVGSGDNEDCNVGKYLPPTSSEGNWTKYKKETNETSKIEVSNTPCEPGMEETSTTDTPEETFIEVYGEDETEL